jgi:hypothetical protein
MDLVVPKTHSECGFVPVSKKKSGKRDRKDKVETKKNEKLK